MNQSHDDQQVADVQTVGRRIEAGVNRLRFPDEHLANRWTFAKITKIFFKLY